jgi:thiol-disulfide isomerase/thioredoxin|tara:strand:+ start:3150 stop:3641 length:492 start_codon:yes stop_codon:yes gene_type:complete
MTLSRKQRLKQRVKQSLKKNTKHNKIKQQHKKNTIKKKKRKTSKNKYKTYFNLLTTQPNNEINMNKDNKVGIVLIYAEWCGHCQALRPDWNNMVNQIDKDKYEIIEINSDEQETGIDNLKKKFLIDSISVEGYPTIGSIQDHKFQPYTGNRDLKTLLEWVQNL